MSSGLNLTHAILSLSTCFAIGGWTRLLAHLNECRSNLTDSMCSPTPSAVPTALP